MPVKNKIPLWTKAFFAKQGLSCAFAPATNSSNDWAKAQAFRQSPENGATSLALETTALNDRLKAQAFRQNLESGATSPALETTALNDRLKAQAFRQSSESGATSLERVVQITQQKAHRAQSFRAFLTERQSAGRGQHNKIWINSDLMISFLWQGDLKKITPNSAKDFAWDLLSALKETWPSLPLNVKAPNDLLLDGKKAGGLLLEPVRQGGKTALIAGLGLNVFSAPIQRATCLSRHIKPITLKKWESFLSRLVSLWSARAFAKPLNSDL